MAAIRDGEAVLEGAEGTGHLFEEVVKQNRQGRNEGIDLTDAMLERAKARLSKLEGARYSLKLGDAYELPCGDHVAKVSGGKERFLLQMRPAHC